MKRNLRPRPPGQYISQQEWELGAQDEADLILGCRYNVLEKFHSVEYQVDHGFVQEMQGEAFNMKYLQENGFTQPIVFRSPTGLEMRIPSPELSVRDIKKLVGSRRLVDVIDTLTQESTIMSLGQWSKYYETFPRKRILNIISLEFSCTKLDPLVEAPEMVRQLDWVEQVWPRDLKKLQTNPTNDLNKMMYPKVQKYCLMSVAGCYTDFHLDFGGTSVWYHVLKGEKQFLLMPPSPESYSLFQNWQMSGEQEGVFLAELMGKAQLIHLHAGDTFMMPSGWIHAVYTPSDSIVFGGNFLHSFNIPQQLMVNELEQDTKVPLKLRYPFFGSIHWYMLQSYAQRLQRLTMRKNSNTEDTTIDEDDSSTPNTRWLKEISVEKLEILSTPEKEKHLECQENLENESATPPYSNMTSPYVTFPFPSLPQPDLSAFNEPPITPTKCPDLQKPHLSPYERGGLLLLIQKMKNALFQQDIPVSIPPTSKLLADLEQLLQSAMSPDTHSLVPTGVGVLNTSKLSSQLDDAPLQCRARKRDCAVKSPESKKLHKECHFTKDDVTFSPGDLNEINGGGLVTISPPSHEILTSPPSVLSLPLANPFSVTSPPPPPGAGAAAAATNILTDLSLSNSHTNCERTGSVQLMAVGGILSALSPVILEYKYDEAAIAKVLNPAFGIAISDENC